MYIQSIGVNYIHNTNFVANRPNGSNEYILLLIRSKAIFKIDGQTTYVNPNSVIVLKKGTPHFFQADNEPYINDWICFDFHSSCDENLFNEIGFCFNSIYEVGDSTDCHLLINNIYREYLNKTDLTERIINNYLEILFYKISECLHTDITPYRNYHNKLINLRNMIYKNPSGRWTIDDLSKRLHLSNSYFQHLYKLQFHISPVADMIYSRIEYAKYLLTNTNYTISQISEELNYGTDIQFIQQFKSVTKTTPFQYRKAERTTQL